MWNEMNRRRFPRAKYPCKITVRKKDHPDSLSAQTENIGLGGICTMLSKDLGIFAPVEIELDLLDGQGIIRCDGSIAWIVERKEKMNIIFDTGIEFTNLNKEDRIRVERIVEKILKTAAGKQ